MDEKLMSVRGDLLIVEDLMLLLMDDDGVPQARAPCTTRLAARCSPSLRCSVGSRPTTPGC